MPTPCLHCQSPVNAPDERFCCRGCAAAYGLLEELSLGKYYDLRGESGLAIAVNEAPLDLAIERAAVDLEASTRTAERLSCDVAGLHCAACVWVIEQVFERMPGAGAIQVHPFVGRIDLDVSPRFDLRGFSARLATLGYRVGKASEGDAQEGRELLVRLGICAAGTMNVMALSLPAYFGQEPGAVQRVMERGSLLLTAGIVVVGGLPFFRSALSSIRARALHLDVPIAMGILLAFGGSVTAWALGQTSSTYFDTVASFTTLMLLGRWLQGRVLAANRRVLLADPGIDDLPALVIEEGRLETRTVGSLALGSSLLLRPGDLLPVDAVATDTEVRVRRDFLSGEASVTVVAPGDRVEAGSVLAGDAAVTVRTIGGARDSRFAALLRTPPAIAEDAARRGRGWALLSRAYVGGTLAIAFSAAAYWRFVAHEPAHALAVLVAVLVVACPCAFGIAVPVGYEAALAALRRVGVFVRSPGLLDRLPDVQHLVFDKTGTLTLGEVELIPGSLDDVGRADRAALYNLAVRSSHPKSRAVVAALAHESFPFVPVATNEIAGAGIESEQAGSTYRLGSSAFVGLPAETGDLVATRDGQLLAVLPTRERARDDAAATLASLERAGYTLHLLSGDEQSRVETFGARLGFAPARIRSHASPEEKAAYVASLTGGTMMIGDGINDAAAMQAADASVTPAGDRPFLASRADCYVRGSLGPGLAILLARAKHLRAVVREAVTFGALYNVVAVAAAVTGHVSPLGAAIVMPASSLFVVAWVAGRLRRAPGTPLLSAPRELGGGAPAVAIPSRGVL